MSLGSFSGHRLHQPGQRGVRVLVGARHDQREHHQGTRATGHRSHLSLSKLQVHTCVSQPMS
jgi:hypothetical protein